MIHLTTFVDYKIQHFKEFVCNKIIHQGKCKPLLAQVLDGGTDMVHLVVYYQETVMSLVEYC